MSFFRRLLSADYRAAVSAEAAGQYEQAAERYALAGDRNAAARAHLARSRRAERRADEIDALRDALHWVEDDAELSREIHARLGKAQLARLRDEGIATDKDRARVREAAKHLVTGGVYLDAGEALEDIGDHQGAARAFRDGGLVERMEQALAREEEPGERERRVRDAFADYEVRMRIGDRDAAREALTACVAAAESTSQYRRLLDDLESRLITGGRVVLRPRRGAELIACAARFEDDPAERSGGVARARVIALGRDPLCELPLRAPGISRRHAEIVVGGRDLGRFGLRDAGSKSGTLIGGMPIAGGVPLAEAGRFALGEHAALEYAVSDEGVLVVVVASGMDRGTTLVVRLADTGDRPAGEASTGDTDDAAGTALQVRSRGQHAPASPDAIDLSALRDARLSALSGDGLPALLWFRRGRPMLAPRHGGGFQLNGEHVAQGAAQLIHGDQLVLGGYEVEVV